MRLASATLHPSPSIPLPSEGSGKRVLRMATLVLLFLVSGFSVSVAAENQELKLWYSQPAEKWTDALPIGNGRMGAMVFGRIVDERIQFNEDTLWKGHPHDYVRDGAGEQLSEIR